MPEPTPIERAYQLIRSQVSAGHQAFIIYPLVEQNGTENELPPEVKATQLSAVEESQRLKKAGLSMRAPVRSTTGKLSGMTFVLTGTLPSYTREEAKRIIEENGGTVASGVSKNVRYVLAGEDAGSKLAKAHQLGIRIISEDEFKGMIG